jgi:hypothetical protein
VIFATVEASLTRLALAGLTGLFLLLALPPALAQSSGNGVLGILGPTGTFRPLLAHPSASAAVTPTTVTGTLSLQLTIKIFSPIRPSTGLQCELDAAVEGLDAQFNITDSILETATAPATRTGSQAVCVVKLPYQWMLNGPKDTLSLNYSVVTTGSGGPGRTGNVSFATRSIPKNGATTSYSFTGRI